MANKQPKQFTLLLLAMAQFQKQPQSNQLSYYQIAGIHGVPRVNYDGVGQCSTCSGTDGYCTHDSILFLGWHRTYLALFEQQLIATAKTIANSYPAATKASYVAAANAMRLPYWDWAAKPPGANTLPIQITQTTVTVQGPSGSQKIANPLYSYQFADSSALVYTPFVSWKNTLRYPTSNANTATSNEGSAIAAFNNIRGSLQDQVYQAFSTCDEFVEIGSDSAGQSSSKCSNSWENIHNTVHTTAGGPKTNGISGGHMTYLSVAAFDPVFWLHHCNIDRLFAMWQAVYPNSYSGSQVAPQKTWTIAKGSTQNVNSPLTPFHKDSSGTFWTTTGVRDTKTLHYTYPEFADSDGSSSSISKYINNLYGPSASSTAGSSKRDAPPRTTLLEVRDGSPLTANNGSLFQYVANIQTSRYALGGTYWIYLFNGDPASEDPTTWLLDSNLIGPMGVLATESMTSTNLVAAGSIPLTRTLTEVVSSGGLLADLTEALVVPYLTANLKWRIMGPSGAEVDPSTVPNFDVSVYASTAAVGSPDQLPQWSEFISLVDVTAGKAGGNSTGSDGNATSSATSSLSGTATSLLSTATGSLLSTGTTSGATSTATQ